MAASKIWRFSPRLFQEPVLSIFMTLRKPANCIGWPLLPPQCRSHKRVVREQPAAQNHWFEAQLGGIWSLHRCQQKDTKDPCRQFAYREDKIQDLKIENSLVWNAASASEYFWRNTKTFSLEGFYAPMPAILRSAKRCANHTVITLQ